MIKIKILSIGKTKESWLDDAINEYAKRLKPIMNIEWAWAKDDAQLVEWVEKEPLVVCLDPIGQQLTSEQFADYLDECWQKGGSRVSFVIGGADGLPKELKDNDNYAAVSLSKLTFTHQITRLVLIEQIYRATEIKRGSKYHK